MSDYQVDPELRAEYIDESLDGLSQIPDLFLELEANPAELQTVEAIFRPVHSIKGNAAYFDLMKVKTLSHEMETVLDLVRKNALFPSKPVIDTLLAGLDELTRMLERARRDEPEITDTEAFEALVQRVIDSSKGEKEEAESLWKKLLDSFKEHSNPREVAADALPELYAKTRDLLEKLVEVTPEAHKLLEDEGKAPSDAPPTVQELRGILSQPVETHLDEASADRVGELLKEIATGLTNEEAQKELAEAMTNFDLFKDTVGVDPVLCGIIEEKLDKLEGMGAFSTGETSEPEAETPAETAPERETEAAEEPKEAEKKADPHKMDKTMRVTESSIDDFLAYVGDLVVIGEMYQHLQNSLAEAEVDSIYSRELMRVNEAFDDLSGNLQHSIMQIRKVPLRAVFQKLPRIIRDVANANDKEIETVVQGEAIQVDKSLADALEAPLMHMARNSADHGVEKPEEREAAGKTRVGKVELLAEETGDFVFVRVRDDGKGLNLEALQKKAADIGLIAPDQPLSKEELVNLLFSSGVSTAEKITDVSGRGVGMDVARQNVEALGGKILVETEQGKGSVFTIQMPKSVSTQIITGFSVVVGTEHFIIPMNRIIRCFRPRKQDIVTVQNRGECVQQDGAVISISRFSKVCRVENARAQKLDEGILIVVESQKQMHALQVDDIEGVKQVVLKQIDKFLNEAEIFMGGAVMGDGRISMVVDVDQFIRAAREG